MASFCLGWPTFLYSTSFYVTAISPDRLMVCDDAVENVILLKWKGDIIQRYLHSNAPERSTALRCIFLVEWLDLDETSQKTPRRPGQSRVN